MSLHYLFAEGGDMAASNASVGVRTQSPSYQAHQILHLAFVVAPLIAGALGAFAFARLATEFDTRS
jgi:hypothetical protein